MVDKVISKEELGVFANLKKAAQDKLLLAQKAIAESQAAELEWRNSILQVFVKYGMALNDSFDENTGEIKKAEVVAEEPSVEVVDEKS